MVPGSTLMYGIQLEHREFEAARFEDCGEGGGSDTFAKGGNYTTCDKDEFGHFRVSAHAVAHI